MNAPINPFRLFLRPLLCGGACLLLSHSALYAGSATWSSNPISNEWNDPSNWIPATVPNGEADVATFAASSQTTVSISAGIEVHSIVFEQGANAFTLVLESPADPVIEMAIYGTGIINNSGVLQNFIARTGPNFQKAVFSFYNSSSAGAPTSFKVEASKSSTDNHSEIDFYNSSSADGAIITNEGPAFISAFGGTTAFWDSATAGSATIEVNGGRIANALNAHTYFYDVSSADHATLIVKPALGANAFGGYINFLDSSTAAQATLIARGTITGHSVGRVDFSDATDGASARVELFGNGTLGIGAHFSRGIQIGSIEGDGSVDLGRNPLTVGTNNRSTTFSGQIQDGGVGGSLSKIGTGTLILSGASNYAGATTISEGFLRVDNTVSSGTGYGPVLVNAGTLGGKGIIADAVTIGSGSGSGAFIAPGSGNTTLTIQSTLTFRSDGTYTWRVRPGGKSDKLVANGVTIESGAQIAGLGRGTLTAGTMFTAISNTSDNPITGTFANLADGETIKIGSNTFQANYEGGDGNDLTLTVVQ